MNRRLGLKRETLTELTATELTGVAAGGADAATSPLKYCLTNLSDLSCYQSCMGSCWCTTNDWC